MKILLAEDDASVRAIVTLALSRVGGHNVVHAANGLELLEIVQKENPALILLDVMMPGLNGFETCERLKQDPNTQSIPVIFLSARAQVHEIEKGMSLGAIGYILKPFDAMTLHTQISEVLNRGTKPVVGGTTN